MVGGGVLAPEFLQLGQRLERVDVVETRVLDLGELLRLVDEAADR